MAKTAAKEKKITEGDKTMEKVAQIREKNAVKEEIPVLPTQDQLDITKLKNMNMTELSKIARELDINGISGIRKQDLIFKILQGKAEKAGLMFGERSEEHTSELQSQFHI